MALIRPDVFIFTSDAAGERALRCERHSGGEALGPGSRSETRTGQSVEVTQLFLPGTLLESHALELVLIDSHSWNRVEHLQSCKEGNWPASAAVLSRTCVSRDWEVVWESALTFWMLITVEELAFVSAETFFWRLSYINQSYVKFTTKQLASSSIVPHVHR
jgi:hypothetical protein